MENNRKCLVLYTAATCNLACRYCSIDKNPALIKIDQDLEENFKTDYFFNFAKEVFPDPFQLEEIQTWGGEPFLGMERAHETFRNLIRHYPNLNQFMSSTNCTCQNWEQQVFNLLQILGEDGRIFNCTLQLSLDGPQKITDASRGKGVTELLFKNVQKLMELIQNESLPSNIKITFTIKPTLDTEVMYSLTNMESIINYYKIFDDLIEIIKRYDNPQITIFPPVPNFATPCLATVKDGKHFARIAYLTRTLEKLIEAGKETPLKHLRRFTPYGHRRGECNCPDINMKGGLCGLGRSVVGLLPNRQICLCHSAFTESANEYFENLGKTLNTRDATIGIKAEALKHKLPLLVPFEEYPAFERRIHENYFQHSSSAILGTLTLEILTLAHAGQIDSDFKTEKKARIAALELLMRGSYCLRDNLGGTGVMTLHHGGLLKLLLNGAFKHLIGEEDNYD